MSKTKKERDDMSELREKLAELAHSQWSGWMQYIFPKGTDNPDGTWTMPKWAVERWKRQMLTPYPELSEDEKNSDREEADKFLIVIKEPAPAQSREEEALQLAREINRTWHAEVSNDYDHTAPIWANELAKRFDDTLAALRSRQSPQAAMATLEKLRWIVDEMDCDCGWETDSDHTYEETVCDKHLLLDILDKAVAQMTAGPQPSPQGEDDEAFKIALWQLDEIIKTGATQKIYKDKAIALRARLASADSSARELREWRRGYFCAVAKLITLEGVMDSSARELFGAGGDWRNADPEDRAVFEKHGAALERSKEEG